jgi:hypothetical protein
LLFKNSLLCAQLAPSLFKIKLPSGSNKRPRLTRLECSKPWGSRFGNDGQQLKNEGRWQGDQIEEFFKNSHKPIFVNTDTKLLPWKKVGRKF